MKHSFQHFKQDECIIFVLYNYRGDTVVQWLALSPHSKSILGSNQPLGPFCVEFACSPRACVGFLRSQSKDMQVNW